ncbi:Phosphate transport system regulatory protein PhoU [Geitlerinema sp. FC II]|uniref:phosphate signaling complex protein PhoU n=1 Tax=Baaleninema simplex TaxID=2862350 RepID=UPI000345FB2F|nr:phosphate signaling complex protein PhoU [Baaleninema simplex]PPT06516.1 Phosphate transport system regulatory protein PhoU [Geitlerinema sp. FC II]
MNFSSSKFNSSRQHFQRELKRLRQDVLRMGALVEQACRLSHSALFDRDLAAAQRLVKLDKQIDRFYRQIESDSIMLLTLQAPVAQDCRVLGAFMQLVRDLERIGDYAKDLAEIAVKLFPYPPLDCMAEIERMSRETQAMLAMSLKALVELDPEAGSQMKQKDTTVDDAYDRLYQRLAYQRNYPGILEPILLVTLAIRHLERMADHATNIGQRVTYIVTGQRG